MSINLVKVQGGQKEDHNTRCIYCTDAVKILMNCSFLQLHFYTAWCRIGKLIWMIFMMYCSFFKNVPLLSLRERSSRNTILSFTTVANYNTELWASVSLVAFQRCYPQHVGVDSEHGLTERGLKPQASLCSLQTLCQDILIWQPRASIYPWPINVRLVSCRDEQPKTHTQVEILCEAVYSVLSPQFMCWTRSVAVERVLESSAVRSAVRGFSDF